MTEYIDKAALYRKICEREKSARDRWLNTPLTSMTAPVAAAQLTACTNMKDWIADFPSAEVAPVVHGQWIEDENGEIVCSECEVRIPEMYSNADSILPHECKFCHSCGARMDKDVMDFMTKRLNMPLTKGDRS